MLSVTIINVSTKEIIEVNDLETIVTIVGGGLAGCEAAWQLAKRNIKVRLYEMRPIRYTPAHHTPMLAELVCSNSLRSNQLENAVGLLKEEMRKLGSLIMEAADNNSIPAGGALAVDREKFSQEITNRIENHPNIELIREEVVEIPEDGYTIIASGPLTSEQLSKDISKKLNSQYLYFYDAAAPIVTAESIDSTKTFKASRYGKGEDDYINCPMNKDEYLRFWEALVNAETAEVKSFEKQIVFEGCMPVEVMAKRGVDTLLYGPLKPVGLSNPITNEQPHAVVQLRMDNKEGTLYNIVGFQTHLKWGEQKRVFSMIPGLEKAEIVRYGVMHRNTYINSPKLLTRTYGLRENERIYFAGQITGVEGYVESTSSGLVAGIALASKIKGGTDLQFPINTAIGALANYVSTSSTGNFQPMNINYGIFPSLNLKIRDKKQKNAMYAQKSFESLQEFVENNRYILA